MDFELVNTGSFFVLIPRTAASQIFTQQNLIHDETIEYGGGIVVEPRYIDDIVEMLADEGFEVANA